MNNQEQTNIKGGEFLIKHQSPAEIFIPEEFSEDQKMMAEACQQFIEKEIYSRIEEIEHQENEIGKKLLEKAGEIGLLGVSVPENYGGIGMSFNTDLLIVDVFGSAGSFSTTYGAHTGIGTLPILYYGNEEQKSKYLPQLVSGNKKAAYCLTEPSAGSDANNGKTKATLTADGKHYLLNGQKMWISNGGFADVFIVFAKIEDDKNLSAFIVERDFGGITMNEEERKMGIKGSSTRQLFFNDTKVPIENLLSTRENGFKIAVNILNIGRIKLAAGVLNGCRHTLDNSIQYANQRIQFNTPISHFGAVREKLARMAIKTFVTESAIYRTGKNIENAIEDLVNSGMNAEQAKLKGVEQFAIECAGLKVHASEVLSYVVDEGVQIYGGMGFSEEAPMARAYRDARITRIYEGTNEINRILMVGMTFKRAMKGELPLISHATAVANELLAIPNFGENEGLSIGELCHKYIKNLKKLVLLLSGKAVQKYGMELDHQQELLMRLANISIEAYTSESALLRAMKMKNLYGEEKAAIPLKMAVVYIHEAMDIALKSAKEAANLLSDGDELKMLLLGIKRFTKTDNFDIITEREEIAKWLVDNNKFDLRPW